MRKILLLFLTGVFLQTVNAQVNGYVENFDDLSIDGWQADARTFELSAQDSALKIAYHRVADSWEWDNFNFTPAQKVNADNTPHITVRAKSDIITQLTLKPIYDSGNSDWLQVMLPADNQWHTYAFDLLAPAPRKINRIYFYLDGGTTTPKSGTVFLDDLRLADSVRAADLLNIGTLEQAIHDAHALYDHSVEGNEEGQFPSGSKQALQEAITAAEAVFQKEDVTQPEIDEATWNLLDVCSQLEAQVHGPNIPLVDPQATIQTRYLYLNLGYLQGKALLFGMQDATGYGVGWSGDDDRSDVKDVCGDYPAVDSEEMYKVTRNQEPNRVRYRLISHYQRGGVVAMCWHEYDPEGRGFYAKDVNYENVVQTLLPGGKYHQQYKEKLRKVALFFKGLRSANGESVPVIFRPYHEHNGNWFWWGKTRCSTQQYNDLWRFTVTYLRDSLHVHNLMYAISPSLDRSGWGDNYKEIFPGEDYVDIYGVDHYFADAIYSADKENFRAGLHRVAEQALADNKLVALTEVGQEGLETADFFTGVLLHAIQSDTLNNAFSYAAVWRNASTNHFFAPYPGHSSVPDFLKFYKDPFTFFASDLPDMYAPVQADTVPPCFVEFPASPFVATDTVFTLSVTTGEKAHVKYDFSDRPFAQMAFEFERGQGQFEHRTTLHGHQGQHFDVYIRARDLFGNAMDTSLVVHVQVDTMQRVLYWCDVQYDAGRWASGQAPFVFKGQSGGNTTLDYSRTVYFRKEFTLPEAQNYSMLAAIVSYNDGCVLYLNGHEVQRVNMPEDGPVQYATWATSVQSATKQVVLDSADLKALRNGTNVLGVEVHQATQDSSTLKFDLKLLTPSYDVLVDFNEDWLYFAAGREPETQILGQVGLDPSERIVRRFELQQNYPNPFNARCQIRYYLPTGGRVELIIFDVLGRKVRTLVRAWQPSGAHLMRFDASNLPSGIYFYRLSFGRNYRVRKMILLK